MTDRQIEAISKFEEKYFWYVARRELLEMVLHSLALPDNARILEVGPGCGASARMLANFGTVLLAEPSELFRKYLAAKGFEAIDASLPELEGVSGPFDLICLFDVLEHVEDDVGALRRLAEKLAPGGRILLTVPALPLLYGGYDVSVGHFRRYDANMLKAVAHRGGLSDCWHSYFNFFLMPLVMASRGWSALRGKEPADLYWMPPAWLNKLLLTIFRMEKRLFMGSWLPAGTSLAMVLEKPARQAP